VGRIAEALALGECAVEVLDGDVYIHGLKDGGWRMEDGG
jgi:hypothetical protein